MKYKAIIETDEFDDFEFYEDGNGKYIHGIDVGSVNGEWIALYFTECKQESVLDKIRAEIKKAVWEDVIVSLDGTDETRISRLDPDDVFKIIDKYRESEE